MSGYVTFVLDGRELAGGLEQVREIVRADGVEALAGARAPVSGLLELRGSPVPVVDLRSAANGHDRGDVMVLSADPPASDGTLGLVVDRVLAVLGPDALVTVTGGDRLAGLPAYVRDVLRRADGGPAVLLVDLPTLAGIRAQT